MLVLPIPDLKMCIRDSRGTSWKAKLRVTVDKAIWSSVNYDEFIQKMQLAGYEAVSYTHLDVYKRQA